MQIKEAGAGPARFLPGIAANFLLEADEKIQLSSEDGQGNSPHDPGGGATAGRKFGVEGEDEEDGGEGGGADIE
jgi:hypothetical protein